MRKPTQQEWDRAVADGFRSNGSSRSPDTVFGVRIAHADESYPPLPADLHDFRYFCGGSLLDRNEADAEFLVELYTAVDHLPSLRREAARRRCRLYFEAVDEFGESAWNLREEPRYGRG